MTVPPRALRALVVTAVAGLALLLGAAPALGHAQFLGSDPEEGATLDTAPDQVSLQFNENIPAEFAAVTVVGPDGEQYQTGEVSAGDGTVVTTVELGPAGEYEIGYRVISDDGHPISGSVPFTLTTAGPAAPATTTAPPAQAAEPEPAVSEQDRGDQGTPMWPWIVGAVVLVGGGAAAALRLGRG